MSIMLGNPDFGAQDDVLYSSPYITGKPLAGPVFVAKTPGYEMLVDVLQRAYNQAAIGKGAERHANNKPFHTQPMQDLIRLHGLGFATGQASKKASEALNLPSTERQVAELLGAIVYLSGAVIALEAAAAAEKNKA